MFNHIRTLEPLLKARMKALADPAKILNESLLPAHDYSPLSEIRLESNEHSLSRMRISLLHNFRRIRPS
jgi:hypothetical protein